MQLIPIFLKELQQESKITRKMLERIPDDKYNWKPHPKSMTIKQLSTHIAELPGWIAMALTTNGLDFAANPFKPTDITNTKDLLNLFYQSLEIGESHLIPENESKLSDSWILRNGDQVLSNTTKAEVIRMVLNQVTHHRAQLGVYLRLLDIPIPGSYGPSADDPGF